MAFKDVFRGLFIVEDDEAVEIEQEQQEQKERPVRKTTAKPVVKEVVKPEKRQYIAMEKKMPKQNVVNMKQEAEVSSKVCLFEPRVFSDTQDIADELKNRRAILVNLQRIDKVSAKRIIDFLSGTVYAIGGDIQRIGQDIFLCTPDNVEVAGSISEVIETEEPMEERVEDDL